MEGTKPESVSTEVLRSTIHDVHEIRTDHIAKVN